MCPCSVRLVLVAALTTLALGLTPPVQAQRLSPGTRVRVSTIDTLTVGRVTHATADSLALIVADGEQVVLPWSRIGRV